ncbi:hypothetical protein HPB51_000835 [Rhipicephalus microplus]|uniref:MADF domain-containing protein n=1 Tax=Rhipicephalus microplus TaxID=6941 RepID=A0A9J6EKV0_RHIMP|nr:hypothetical protein HPB51_000835 [Rhipicephalus microplus]
MTLITLWEEHLSGLRGQKRNAKIYSAITEALASRAVLQLSCEEQAMDGAFIDNEILIAAVQHRLPLWMASHRHHKDKIVKAAMWREVAAAVLPNVNIDDAAELVQKRWKLLRDKFQRLFVANKKAKSGAGLDDVECITILWPYFELLYVLKDSMQTRT